MAYSSGGDCGGNWSFARQDETVSRAHGLGKSVGIIAPPVGTLGIEGIAADRFNRQGLIGTAGNFVSSCRRGARDTLILRGEDGRFSPLIRLDFVPANLVPLVLLDFAAADLLPLDLVDFAATGFAALLLVDFAATGLAALFLVVFPAAALVFLDFDEWQDFMLQAVAAIPMTGPINENDNPAKLGECEATSKMEHDKSKP